MKNTKRFGSSSFISKNNLDVSKKTLLMLIICGVTLQCCECKVIDSDKLEALKEINRVYSKSRLPGEFKNVYASTKLIDYDLANYNLADYNLAGHGLAEHELAEHELDEHELAEHELAQHELATHNLVAHDVIEQDLAEGDPKDYTFKNNIDLQENELSVRQGNRYPTNAKKKLAFIAALAAKKLGTIKLVALGVGLVKFLVSKYGGKGFVGRCFGIARKLKFIIPLIIFKLGVIVTTLGFLTIFSLKSLGIGVLLLIMNVSKFLAKFIVFKGFHGFGHQQSHDSEVHYHIHSKPGHHEPHYYHPPKYEYGDQSHSYGIWDRLSDRLGQASTVAERNELLDMYQRLGIARAAQGRSIGRL